MLTWAAGRYGAPAVTLAAGAGCLLVAVGGLFTPIRRAGAEPAAAQPGLRPAPAGGTSWSVWSGDASSIPLRATTSP